MVSIVLLNWNGAHDTIECLGSVGRLAYPCFEAIVVDNASSDDSVVRIRDSYPKVRIIRSRANLGFAAGNNLAIREALAAGSDYVWLLNNDTRVAPNTLDELVQAAERDPQIGAVGSVSYHASDPERVEVWGGGYVSLWSGRTRIQETPHARSELHYLSAVSVLLRSSTLHDVGLLDERFFMYWEDADLGFRIRRGGWRLSVASQAAIWHKGTRSTGGLGNPKAYEMYSGSARRFFRLHSPAPWVPTGVRLVGGMAKWALKRDWRRVAILFRSVLNE